MLTLPQFCIDERLPFAQTIPAPWYLDPAALELELDRIFASTWQLVGRTEQVDAPGKFFTATVGREPVVVVCGNDHQIRAFSNVCRHRAGPVSTGAGSCSTFRCGYHGWSYALDGRLIGTPEFDGVECFQKETFRLPEFQVVTWFGLVFVNCDPQAAPLDEYFDGIADRIIPFDVENMRYAFRKDWYVDCNWKVYVDNYLEGYHIPIVHPGLNKELDYAQYRTETRRYYSIQHSPVKNANRIRVTGNLATDRAEYFWIFPNLMLNVYPDNFSTNLIIPLGPEKTLTIFEWFFLDPEEPHVQEKLQQQVEFSDEIQIEDIHICEAVQRGLKSKTYTSGRYSVKRENGVHHFHQLLGEFLFQESQAQSVSKGNS